MHAFGNFKAGATGVNFIYGLLINSLFNACVSIFVLISGYFGVKTSFKKILRLWIMVVVFSLIGVAVSFASDYYDGTMEVLKVVWKSIFPISSVKYWYITAYFLLMIFADYINKIPEKLDRKRFERLLLLLLIVFSILPTLTFMHVMNDGGKGFANMFLVYLIGRYIKFYGAEINIKDKRIDIDKWQTSKLVLLTFSVLALEFALNMAVSLVRGGVGVSAPFARDCSILIVLLAICIFLLFQRWHFTSKKVNKIATHVLGVYLVEGSVRTILGQFFNISTYGESWYLFAVLFVYVIVVVAVSMIIDWIYKMTVGRVADALIEKIKI